MSGADDIGPITSKDDLGRAFRSLAQRVDELEGELAAERERRQELEAQQDLVEIRRDGDREGVLLEDIHVAGVPIGRIITAKASQSDLEELEERIDDMVADSVNGEVDPERALPIMQVTRTYKTDPETLRNENERRAAIVWSNFFDTCSSGPAAFALTSSDVRTILATAEDGTPHDETVRRVMQLVADLGKEYVTLEKRHGRNTLVIDREPFEAYTASLQDSLEDNP